MANPTLELHDSTGALIGQNNDWRTTQIGGVITAGARDRAIPRRGRDPQPPGPDPMLELHDGNGALLASNDNWRDTQEAEITATMIPPSDDAESAILQTPAPGAYTAIVRGVNNTTGVAMVEVYALKLENAD